MIKYIISIIILILIITIYSENNNLKNIRYYNDKVR